MVCSCYKDDCFAIVRMYSYTAEQCQMIQFSVVVFLVMLVTLLFYFPLSDDFAAKRCSCLSFELHR